MPFTFSHPAIVLPLLCMRKKRVSLTGLVMGSIVPDFEKFIKMGPDNTFSHTWPAVLWFNLPLAFILACVFHNIVRRELINNLPDVFYKRFHPFAHFDWNGYVARHYLVVILSIITGVASHYFWDGFTHDDGIFVSRLVLFFSGENNVLLIHNLSLNLFYASSVAGVLGILYAVLRLPVTDAPVRENRNVAKYWMHAAGVFFFIIAFRLLTDLSVTQYWELLYTSITAGMISMTVTPLLRNIRDYKHFSEEVL